MQHCQTFSYWAFSRVGLGLDTHNWLTVSALIYPSAPPLQYPHATCTPAAVGQSSWSPKRPLYTSGSTIQYLDGFHIRNRISGMVVALYRYRDIIFLSILFAYRPIYRGKSRLIRYFRELDRYHGPRSPMSALEDLLKITYVHKFFLFFGARCVTNIRCLRAI